MSDFLRSSFRFPKAAANFTDAAVRLKDLMTKKSLTHVCVSVCEEKKRWPKKFNDEKARLMLKSKQ
jgi:hypothetical protein